MELKELFSDFGLTDEKSAREALVTFSDEYNLLAKNQAIKIAGKVLDLFVNYAMVDLMGSPRDAINLGRLLPKIIGRSSGKLIPIIKKIGQMTQADGPDAFNKVKDYARIAAHVYGNRRDTILPRAWKCLGNSYQGLQLDDEESGLQAALYKKNGRYPKYVYAIAGTRGLDIKDWEANISQLAAKSDQYERAGEISEKLSKMLGTKNIMMVGHSKGGGQAAYCSLRTGCPAITFNPAGLGLYKFKHNLKSEPEINSYVMIFDPLNMMQMLAQLITLADLTADGSVHYLKPAEGSSLKEWHGIEGFLRLGGLEDMQRLDDIILKEKHATRNS